MILYYVLSVLVAILFSVGIFMLNASILKLPTSATQKTMDTLITLDNPKKESIIDKLIGKINKLILPIIVIDKNRRYRLERALEYMGYTITPEEHLANSILFGVIVGAFTLLLMFLHPYFGFFPLILTPLLIKLRYDAPEKNFDQIRESIDIETSQLARFIADALKDGNRNVINILLSCKESVSKNLKKEIERTVTDMKTGNQEKALMDWSTRMNSPNITQIVTGLIGVLKGNNQSMYFEALAEKFKRAEITYVRKKNSLKPAKVSRVSIVLIIAVILQIIVGVILALLEQIKDSGLF